MANSFAKNKNLIRILLIFLMLSWIHQWISIGSFATLNFQNFTFEFQWFLQNRNQLIFLLPLNLLLFFILKKKNLIFFIFFALSIAYLIGYLNYKYNFNNEEDQLIWHLTFVMNIFLSALILNNIDAFNKNEYYEILIIINLTILFLIIFFVFFQKNNIYSNPTYNLNIFGNIKIITSNGLSRSILIIFIFLMCKTITIKKNISYFLIFSCFLSYLIIANESRLNFICLIIATLLILLLSKFSLKKKIAFFFLLIFIPLSINVFIKTYILNTEEKSFENFISNIKNNRLFALQGEVRGESMSEEKIKIHFNANISDQCKELFLEKNLNPIIMKINILTTGRVKKWQCALNLKNDLILGYGPEYDRKIINNNDYQSYQGQDVANAALYAIISGGIIGLSCYILLIFKFVKLCYIFFINKKKYYLKENYFFSGSLITIGYLIGRSFFENGFINYGIDFLLFILCYIYIFKKFNKLENNYQNP